MQNFARKHGEEIDLLSFSQKVLDIANPKKELTTAPEVLGMCLVACTHRMASTSMACSWKVGILDESF